MASSARPAVRPGLVLVVVSIAQLIVALDMTVVNLALPKISGALHFRASDLSWVVNAYSLAFGGLLLLGGRVGDLVGRRRTLLAAATLFGLASLLGGLAGSSAMLIAARALQGVGAAAMAPAALATLTAVFAEGAERTRALTIWTAIAALGGAVGVLAGGALSDYASWRWVLLINLPIVALLAVLGWRELPRDQPRPQRHLEPQRHPLEPDSGPASFPGAGPESGSVAGARAPLDVAGGVLATGGMTALVYGVVRSHDLGWGAAQTVGTLVLAACLLVAFVVVEARVATAPLIRIGVLAHPVLGRANTVTALLCAGQFAALYFVSIQLQEVVGYSPMQAGGALLPFCFGIVAGSVVSMRLAPTAGVAWLVAGGSVLAGAGMLWLSQLGPDSGFVTAILGPVVITSFGLGVAFPPLIGAASSGVAPDEAGMAAGIHNSARQVGGALGLAVLVTVAASRQSALLASGHSAVASLGGAQELGLVVAGALLVAGGLVGLTLPRTPAGALPEATAAPADADLAAGALAAQREVAQGLAALTASAPDVDAPPRRQPPY